MPSASDRMATIPNPGFFTNIRNPYRASSAASRSHLRPHTSRVISFTKPTFPNSRRAAHSASSFSSPFCTRSRAAISRWLRTSSLSSVSRFFRRQKLTGHLCISLLPSSLLFRLKHARDRVGKLRPSGTFLAQLLFSCGGQLVKLCALLVFGDSPFRFNPFLFFQSVERRVERTRIHLHQLAGPIADRHADPVAMLRPPLQGLQNQQVQRPFQKFHSVLVPLSLLSHFSCPSLKPLHAPSDFVVGIDVTTRPFVSSQAVDILPPACRRSTPCSEQLPCRPSSPANPSRPVL